MKSESVDNQVENRDQPLPSEYLPVEPASLSSSIVRGHASVQQEKQQQHKIKNRPSSSSTSKISKKKKKSLQLIPVLDEDGVAIEDHFISPRDKDGDGVPESYVLLRPSVGNHKYMMDVGLFDEEHVHA
ncbi:hypothetical protein BGZ83_004131 [Gryganskiella cystojenkinii]|nr:hypothetical protein BGZ83_004131 [Gryganskiella cystojenkinii]